MTNINIDQYNFTLYEDTHTIYVTSSDISPILLDKINIILSNSMNKTNSEFVEIISNVLKSNKKEFIIINDYMGIFEDTTITKYKLNKNSIYSKYMKNIGNIQSNLLNMIPKELLLNDNSLYKMLINEIERVNNNMSHDHYIVCNDNNIFDLSVRIRYRDNEISKIMKQFYNTYEYDYFELTFHLSKTYPFLPPKIDYIRPKIDLVLAQSIISMDIWNVTNWNYTISLDHLITNLAIALEHHFIKSIDIDCENNKLTSSPFNNIEMKLLHLIKRTKMGIANIIPIDINLITIKQLKDTTNKNTTQWKSGTGYGNNSTTTWDINSYIDAIKLNTIDTIDTLNNIIEFLKIMESYTIDLIFESYIIDVLTGINILDFNKSHEYYHILITLINIIITKKFNISLHFIDNIINITKDLYDIINNILSIDINESSHSTKHVSSTDSLMSIDIYINTYIHFIDTINIVRAKQIVSIPIIQDIVIPSNIKDSYNQIISQQQFGEYNLINSHLYYKNKTNSINKKSMLRIISETSSLRKNLPNSWDSSVILRVSKTNVNLISFVITGPKDTPYHNGIFEFHAYFPDGYPTKVPEVLIATTNGGTFRFNPNLYANGKVCLSLLGTWSGDVGESWNPELSTFLQVIISIQALILVEQPYFNEPGYENTMNTNDGKIKSIKYNENIRVGTIKYAMTSILKNKIPSYETFIENHFKLKKDEIISTVNMWIQESKYLTDDMKIAADELYSILNSI